MHWFWKLHAVPPLHTPPAQQIWPLAPHAVHVPAPGLHASPTLHQYPPGLFAMQHGSLGPPQPAQLLFWHEVNGDVHATLLPQHAWPGPPHVPPPHAPFLQAPVPPLHMLPLPTHVRVERSQQPPLLQSDPSQHGCPGPPQAVQLFWLSQASPEVTQKLPLHEPPFMAPWQQLWPSAPQRVQEPLKHIPTCIEPQVDPDMTHCPSTQQRLPVHESIAQQGCPPPPHVWSVPSTHTDVPVPSPRARQVPPLQQPPPVHAVPLVQQASPGCPHGPPPEEEPLLLPLLLPLLPPLLLPASPLLPPLLPPLLLPPSLPLLLPLLLAVPLLLPLPELLEDPSPPESAVEASSEDPLPWYLSKFSPQALNRAAAAIAVTIPGRRRPIGSSLPHSQPPALV